MFLVIVKDRKDGDYDSIAAFAACEEHSEKWANEIIEFYDKESPQDKFRILRLQNVDEVIDSNLIGLENT